MGEDKVLTRKEKREERKARRKELKAIFSPRHYLVLMWACSMIRLYVRARTFMSPAFKKQKKEGAMLVISNHLSALDFAYFTTPFWGKRVSFVVAENMMYSTPFFATLIQGYHAITKKQFYADYTCVKNIKRYLDAGISVVICPEGKESAEGKTGPIAFSIAKLVKWLKYPVASCVLRGAGLTRPKWTRNFRKNRVECDIDMMLSAEEVKALPPQQIMDKITAALDHNEHTWQIENGLRFRGRKLAEGLEKLLYKCPACGADFTMTASGATLKCSACGLQVEYTDCGELLPIGDTKECPGRIDIWYDWERERVREEISTPGFHLESFVNMLIENPKKNGYAFATAGTLRLADGMIEFASALTRMPIGATDATRVTPEEVDEINAAAENPEVGEDFMRLSFPVKNLITISNMPGDSITLYDDKHTYMMMFPGVKMSTKYLLAIEEINKILHK